MLITTYSAGSGQAELGVLEPVNPSSNLQPLLVGSKTPKWPQSFGFSKTKMEVKSTGLCYEKLAGTILHPIAGPFVSVAF